MQQYVINVQPAIDVEDWVPASLSASATVSSTQLYNRFSERTRKIWNRPRTQPENLFWPRTF